MKFAKILILILFIFTMSLTANAALFYETPGFVKYNMWYGGGTVNLNSSTAVKIPGSITLQGGTPLIDDIDYDGNTEIMIVSNTDYLYIQNFTGTSFSNLASVYLGDEKRYGQTLRYTPGIIDYDLDLNREIVIANSTHFLVYNYTYAAGLTLEQSAKIPTTNSSGSFTDAGAYLVIKCSVAGNYDGNKVCYVQNINKVSLTYDMMLLEYDLTNNTVLNATLASGLWPNYAPAQYRQMTIRDINNDGIQDVSLGLYDVGNGVIRTVYAIQLNDTALSFTIPYNLSTTINYYISDLAVGNFDGIVSNGLEYAYYYRSAVNNYDAKVFNRVGSVITSTFGTTIPVTASTPAINIALPSDSSGQEYFCSYTYYTTGNSKLYCFNGNTGNYAVFTDNTTGYNMTSGSVFSMIDRVNSASGLATGGYISKFYTITTIDILLFTATTLIYSPYYDTYGYTHSVSVDVRNIGSDDMLLSNTSGYAIINTFSINTPPTIMSYGTGTGIPSCQYVVQKYHITLDDTENDIITCHLGYYYTNDTLISEEVKTGLSGVQFEFLKSLDETGSYKATFRCGDSYHKNSTSQTIIQTVSNSTGCYSQDQNPLIVIVDTNETEAAEQEWDDTTEEMYDNIGLSSRKARNAVALILVLLVAVFIYVKTASGLLSVASIPVTLLISFFINLASIFPVIVLLLCVVFLIVWTLLKGTGSGNAPG